jgi:hypothetical protein
LDSSVDPAATSPGTGVTASSYDLMPEAS